MFKWPSCRKTPDSHKNIPLAAPTITFIFFLCIVKRELNTVEAILSSQSANGERVRAWVILLLLSIIWGSSYILIKKGLEVYTPAQVASIRLSISALAFFPFFVARLSRLSWAQLGLLILVGLTGSGIPAFLFATAQTQLSSSVAGILNSLTPIFTLFLGLTFFGASAPSTKLVGIVLGLAGAIALVVMGPGAGLSSNLWYGGLIVLGAVCYAISTNVVGFHLRDVDSLTISAVSFFLVGVPACMYLFFSSDFTTQLSSSPGAWQALGYLTVLAITGTVFASVLFFKLIQSTSPVFGSTVSYIVPAIALLWGIFDGELISSAQFTGLGLILAGVYLSRH